MIFAFSPLPLPDAPRWPKRPPRSPHDGPRCLQEGPKTAQEGAKTAQDGAMAARDGTKTSGIPGPLLGVYGGRGCVFFPKAIARVPVEYIIKSAQDIPRQNRG